MLFTKTSVFGVYVIEIECRKDHRGFFGRAWCSEEFSKHGLNPVLSQCNVSYSQKSGTLRGMHYQDKPHEECKVVRCTSGAIYDVALDLRQGSKTFLKWFGIELSKENRKMLYIPGGVAHGFVTLQKDTEVFYQMSEPYHPECSCGVRWDDPAFGIAWPVKSPVLSSRDAHYPDFYPGVH